MATTEGTSAAAPPRGTAEPDDAGAEVWAATMERLLPICAIIGPALGLVAALFVAAGVQTLPAISTG